MNADSEKAVKGLEWCRDYLRDHAAGIRFQIKRELKYGRRKHKGDGYTEEEAHKLRLMQLAEQASLTLDNFMFVAGLKADANVEALEKPPLPDGMDEEQETSKFRV